MKKTPTVESLLELRYVSDPALSPDGSLAAAVVTRIEEGDPPSYRSRVHLWNLRTGDETPFTQGTTRDTHPRFSPDGYTLAFLSDRTGDETGGKNQVFAMPTSGGEARGLTAFKTGVSEFAWHPDGVRLALLSRGDEEEDLKGLGRRVTRTYYKQDGVGFRPEGIAQIWVLDTRTGEMKQVTNLSTNPSGLEFGADGLLYFAAAKTVEDEGYYYRNVWRMDLETGELRALIDQPNPLLASSPSVSPDGMRVAYLAPCIPERISSPTGLWVVPGAGGTPTLLTGELDCAPLVGGDSRYGALPNAPSWSEDGKYIFVSGNERGSSCVVRVTRTGERDTLQPAGRAVTSFVQQGGRVLFTAETPERPGELFVLNPDGTEQRLSGLNDAFTETYALQTPSEETKLQTSDGAAEIVYWTLSPETPREDGAMVVQVHGGPRTNYGYGFLFEFQLLAAKGYTVVYGNPRGGSSYGYGFSDSISGRLGTIDADDVLSISRDARARHAKPNAPVHLTGGSYGGFMTNWLVTQTDEFTSAVTQRSITNWGSFYGTSDIGFSWIHIETGGNPWEHMQKLWDQSPLKHVANVRTPLLILHAEEDHRCPVEQAEQLFTALRTLGREVAFVRFPGEGHELSRSGRPDRRMQRLSLIVDWFASHAAREVAHD